MDILFLSNPWLIFHNAFASFPSLKRVETKKCNSGTIKWNLDSFKKTEKKKHIKSFMKPNRSLSSDFLSLYGCRHLRLKKISLSLNCIRFLWSGASYTEKKHVLFNERRDFLHDIKTDCSFIFFSSVESTHCG